MSDKLNDLRMAKAEMDAARTCLAQLDGAIAGAAASQSCHEDVPIGRMHLSQVDRRMTEAQEAYAQLQTRLGKVRVVLHGYHTCPNCGR